MADESFDLDSALEGCRVHAPTRDQIQLITDMDEISQILSYAEDKVIVLTTCFEYLVEDASNRQKLAVLIYWKQAVKNLKSRINQLNAETSRTTALAELKRKNQLLSDENAQLSNRVTFLLDGIKKLCVTD